MKNLSWKVERKSQPRILYGGRQCFLGEQGFGQEVSRKAGEDERRKPKNPIETVFKEIASRLSITPEIPRGRDRRWKVSTKG